MYAGKIVESGNLDDIFYHPQHPYTWGLLKSIPRLDASKKGKLVPIHGTPPDLLNLPKGCRFAPRCEHCMQVCTEQMPEYSKINDGHQVACWLQHPQAPKVAFEGRG